MKMKTREQIEEAYKAIHNGDGGKIPRLDERIVFHIRGHSWHNPNWAGTGFEQALLWVLDYEVDGKKVE